MGGLIIAPAIFLKTRAQLRKQNLDFSPVAEFGIGLMAVFMLGDNMHIDTALAFPEGDDTQRRELNVDGLGRLIEVREHENKDAPRNTGTTVSVTLSVAQSKRARPHVARGPRILSPHLREFTLRPDVGTRRH